MSLKKKKEREDANAKCPNEVARYYARYSLAYILLLPTDGFHVM